MCVCVDMYVCTYVYTYMHACGCMERYGYESLNIEIHIIYAHVYSYSINKCSFI